MLGFVYFEGKNYLRSLVCVDYILCIVKYNLKTNSSALIHKVKCIFSFWWAGFQLYFDARCKYLLLRREYWFVSMGGSLLELLCYSLTLLSLFYVLAFMPFSTFISLSCLTNKQATTKFYAHASTRFSLIQMPHLLHMHPVPPFSSACFANRFIPLPISYTVLVISLQYIPFFTTSHIPLHAVLLLSLSYHHHYH